MLKKCAAMAAVLLSSTTLADLVEINTSSYFRDSGNPSTDYLEVTLEYPGEIRVANVNLQDDSIELASSTDVLLDGTMLMQPFSVPTGGSTVFPLTAGTHFLEITMRGKPGGGLRVSIYEDKPGNFGIKKGWELLEDGTVAHLETGLIFHRNPLTPGLQVDPANPDSAPAKLSPAECTASYCAQFGKIEDYIEGLNSGAYGTSSTDGNAGHNDWRVLTTAELAKIVDQRASFPALSNASGNVIPYDIEGASGYQAGMRYGEPLLLCPGRDSQEPFLPDCRTETTRQQFRWGDRILTTTPSNYPGYGLTYFMGMDLASGYIDDYGQAGFVWPVRGELHD